MDSPHTRQRLLDFAWDQWAQMGLFAERSRRDRWVMDPEALVVFTLSVGRSDPRLFDELLDWLLRNGRLVSVQRLRNLSRGDDELARLVGAALEWVSVSNGSIKIPSQHVPRDHPDAEALFVIDDKPLRITRPDPSFKSFGLLRQTAHPRGRSTSPSSAAPINLAFRLRSLFGVSSRAECVRCLLTDPRMELSVADIADVAGYAKRNVADALGSLASARAIIESARRNERRYSLDRHHWAAFLQLDLAELGPHRNWPALLRALTMIDRWIARTSDDVSAQVRASSARDLTERIGADLTAAGIPLPPNRPGASYLDGFSVSTDAALAFLEAGSGGQ